MDEIDGLRWLANMFPFFKNPKDDGEKMSTAINLYTTAAVKKIEQLMESKNTRRPLTLNELVNSAEEPVFIGDVCATFCEIVGNLITFYTFGSEIPMIMSVKSYGETWVAYRVAKDSFEIGARCSRVKPQDNRKEKRYE